MTRNGDARAVEPLIDPVEAFDFEVGPDE